MATASATRMFNGLSAVSDLLSAALLSPPVAPARPARRQAVRRRPVAARPGNWLIRQSLENGRPLVPAEGDLTFAYRCGKRAFDLLGASALLLVLSPFLLTIYLLLLFTTRANPLYCQRRVGHRGKTFTMFKFRTMRPDADAMQHCVANEATGPVFKSRRDPRIIPLGRFLRKTSLDETPQLLNVLLGQMSLVGPRPLPLHEVADFRAWHCRRLAVRPGLTCLWQVSGRSEVGFEDWVRMDLWYVRNQSLWTDCKLLLRTPFSVLSCRGAY